VIHCVLHDRGDSVAVVVSEGVKAGQTLTALILIHVVLNLPLTVWLLMGFVRDIPVELEDAARVDGCTPFQVFRKVVLPLVAPGLIAAGVLAFVFSWNEFSVALTLASRASATVPIGIASSRSSLKSRTARWPPPP